MSAPRPDGESAPAASGELLTPLDAVAVGAATIVVDAARPVAAIVTDDEVRFVTWPDAPRPAGAVEEAEVRSTPEGAWVVYRDASGDASPRRTAVHLTPEGVTAAVDLGTGRPIGADASGLWIGDPRDASEWMGTFPGGEELDGGGLDADADADAADLDPSTLPWIPETSFWPDPADWTEPIDAGLAEHDHDHDHHAFVVADTDDDVGPDDDDVGWTLDFGNPGDVGDSADASSDPQPDDPSPTPPTDLHLLSPAGERSTIRVDHLVDEVRRDGDVIVLRYHRCGPRHETSSFGGGWDVVYEPREVRVDVTDGLPDGVDTDELPWQPAPEPQEEDWEREENRREEVLAPWRDRLDLAGVEGARWPLAPLDQASRDAAVAALRARFERLDEPNIVWTREHPEPRRGRSPYRSLEVETVGSWPTTELLVSFEHADVPFLRLRRRYRVFDDTGWPLDWLWVSVHLDEDIATRQIPARSEAVDGVLDT